MRHYDMPESSQLVKPPGALEFSAAEAMPAVDGATATTADAIGRRLQKAEPSVTKLHFL
jgi:hypothetical protein